MNDKRGYNFAAVTQNTTFMKTAAKKSFILYTEINTQLQLLSDEEAGVKNHRPVQ